MVNVLTTEACLFSCAQEEGRVTLRLMSKAGRVSSAGNVVGIVRNLISEDASRTVGRVRMLKDGPMEGAAFDLPEDIALEMLAKKHDLEVCSGTKPTHPPLPTNYCTKYVKALISIMLNLWGTTFLISLTIATSNAV